MNDSRTQSGAAAWVGTVLGNYRIVGAIRTGGMGSVFRAQHELLGRPAAVKVLRPELTANPELVQRFFNEAKAATAIRHPGIVEVYDFGYADDGHAYIVMELLDGEPLGQRIAARGRLTELEAADIARGIASALKAAHGKGIVHRDLKPDNVFLVPDADLPSGERVKVLDFGVAKLADASPASTQRTQTGALMGTPLYMAPEQARAAGTIDARADLYSLGCILFELLIGKPPFVAEGAGEIIAMQLFSEPAVPAGLMSPEMEHVVRKLLAKEPHERYQSAAELSAALGARLSGRLSEPSDAAPSSPATRPSSSSSGFQATPPPITPPPGALRTTFAGDGPMPAAPPVKRSSMPLVAGAIALAAGVAVFVFARGGDNDAKPRPVAGKPAPVTEKPAPIAAPPAKVEPAPAPAPAKLVEAPPPPAKLAVPPPPKAPVVARPPKRPRAPSTGPVTGIPTEAGPVTSPSGAHTTNHSPIETTLDDTPPAKASP